MNKDDEILGLAFLFLSGRGAKGTVTPGVPKVTPKVVNQAIDAVAEGAALVARANQSQAQGWISNFEQLGAPGPFARALSRWVGIESSGYPAGDPKSISKNGERGLVQLSRTTALVEKAITPAEWEALNNPKTTRDEQARIAMKVVEWLWQRASKHVTRAPGYAEDKGQEYIDRIWVAKLYHQRPVDVRDGKIQLPAATMAKELAQRWANDKQKMKYLRAANVVAWGTPEPP